jgi:type II secretory ATPase GspE/PulE/Tfp pilus assembly ATPase PilB-like protein
MCTDVSAVASAVELVLNQRLIRKLCAECRGEECHACLQTGYQGRVPLVEWLRLTNPMRAQIRSRDLSAIQPEVSLADSARELLRQSLSNSAEIKRVLGS